MDRLCISWDLLIFLFRIAEDGKHTWANLGYDPSGRLVAKDSKTSIQPNFMQQLLI